MAAGGRTEVPLPSDLDAAVSKQLARKELVDPGDTTRLAHVVMLLLTCVLYSLSDAGTNLALFDDWRCLLR